MTLITLPCTMLELETALHRYGDHHGFDKKVEPHVLDNGTVEFRVKAEDEC